MPEKLPTPLTAFCDFRYSQDMGLEKSDAPVHLITQEAAAGVVLFEQLYSCSDRTNFALASGKSVAFGVCPEAKVITKCD
ncbi:hypothetical protein WN944_005189 [Citrus x changshan-huyou]|uniref:Uncharacterized protein n=1 Tax=Citrus x changshan-huyou TaxID=2935761 RepID=A0AAP0M4I7_9ROSI